MFTAVFMLIASLIFVERLWNAVLWWRPKRIAAILQQQGISVPSPGWLGGNLISQEYELRAATRARGMPEISHDIVSHVTPEAALWSSLYGKPHLTWWLQEPRVYLYEPECFREVLSRQAHCFVKSRVELEFAIDLLGRGLVGVNGKEWMQHRTLLAPAFHAQKLKGMAPCMEKCAENLVEKWRSSVADGEAEIEVTEGLKKFAADVISQTAFGSNYEKGEQVFEGLNLLAELLAKAQYYSWLPFFRYLPISANREAWRVRRQIDKILFDLIRERRNSGVFGSDLLGLILQESEKDENFTESTLVDECKTFYFTGHETTSSLLGWTLLLLAVHPEWQEQARAEVNEHFPGNDLADGESISKLRVVGMILYESMRLYPAITEVQRIAEQDTVVNGLRIPKGTGVVLPILSLHHDATVWGSDVNEFNPKRFEQGVANAGKHPNAFIPFTSGPRVCIGQAFALIEAKIAVAMLLKSFTFKVSPRYKHNPTVRIVVEPEHGIQLLVETVKDKY